MKLYYAPGACSLGIHVLLEELGKPYETSAISLREGDQYKPAYLHVSPKSKVPALELDDGSMLTEYGAIATYLARTHQDKGLVPSDPVTEARVIEAMDYIVGTVHMQGFARIFRPENFGADAAGKEAVQARGREIFSKGLDLLNHTLDGQEWLVGSFSIADTALFYVSFWAGRVKLELPANVARHFAAMKSRPAVQAVMSAEGLS